MEKDNEYSREKSVINSANQNKEQLIQDIQKAVTTLDAIIRVNKKIIDEAIQTAKKNDINYVPDMEQYNKFIIWKEGLEKARERLEKLEVSQENVLEQGEFMEKIQNFLETINLVECHVAFIKSNGENIDNAFSRKEKIGKDLADLENKLNELRKSKDFAESQSIIAKEKLDHMILKALRKKQIQEYNSEIELNNENKTSIDEEIKKVEKEIKDKKRLLLQSRFNGENNSEYEKNNENKNVNKPENGETIQNDSERID